MSKLLHKLRYIFKPRELFQRLGEKSKNSLRISKLRNTPAENLNKLQINSNDQNSKYQTTATHQMQNNQVLVILI